VCVCVSASVVRTCVLCVASSSQAAHTGDTMPSCARACVRVCVCVCVSVRLRVCVFRASLVGCVCLSLLLLLVVAAAGNALVDT